MSTAQATKLGVIGGSGVYQMDGAKLIAEHKITTPYGEPSDLIVEAQIDNRSVFFLPRHGRGHRLLPSEVNYRANIYAMKQLGVNCLLAVSAVGIMTDNIAPGDMVVPQQIFDRTKGVRASSFFGNGVAGHVEFADPFCPQMIEFIEASVRSVTDRCYTGGAYVCIEGPQFSTRAESNFYRETLRPSVIGMTGVPEAKLAREAEICYGMLALATDYDCWHEVEEDVNVESVLRVLRENSQKANQIIRGLAAKLPESMTSPIFEAAKFAIITAQEAIPTKRREELQLLYGKYFNK